MRSSINPFHLYPGCISLFWCNVVTIGKNKQWWCVGEISLEIDGIFERWRHQHSGLGDHNCRVLLVNRVIILLKSKFLYPFPLNIALISVFCLTDGTAKILAQFLSFYLPCDKYSYWSEWQQALKERECMWGGTWKDRSTKNLWLYLGYNPGCLHVRWVL